MTRHVDPATGRVFYRVRRPALPTEIAWALVQAFAGAGGITLALRQAGLI